MENAFGNPPPKAEGLPAETLKCAKCGGGLAATDGFCGACGAKVDPGAMTGLDKFWNDEVEASVRKASKWILAIGAMFFIFGTFFGIMQKEETDKSLANLAQYADTATWSVPLNGETVTVGELKRTIKIEYWSVFVLNWFLGFVMVGIFFWSKQAPFSAFVTALSVYIGVQVLSAIADPKTIAQGIIIKAIVIGALINGIKAAIPTRGLSRGNA
jgi:hypothetical protein